MNSNSGVYVIFKVGGELGRIHYFPVNLLRLKKAFFDEVLLIQQKIFDFNNARQQRLPIFPIECIKPEIFRIFLDWGYFERLNITKENALDLVLASEYLSAPTLVVSCAKFLASNALAVENVWLAFNFFRRIEAQFDNEIEYEHLIAAIKKYIKKHFDKLWKADEFLCLDFADALEFLTSDILGVDSETIVYEAAIRWLDAKPKVRVDNAFEIFSAIRMTYLPSDFLYNNVRNNKFVKGIPYMEDLFNVNWQRLMNNERAADSPGPRLRNSEIWAVNMNQKVDQLIDIHVLNCHNKVFTVRNCVGGGRRTGFATARLQNSVFVIGGWMPQFPDGSPECDVLLFNTEDGCEEDLAYNAIKSLNVGRYGHCAVSYDGSIYTFGGRTSNYECISELEVYGQDGWTSLNEVNLLPRAWAASVTLDRAIYVVGGANGKHEFTELERFDPRSGTTDLLQPIPTCRKRLSAAVFDNKIYVVGGERYVEAGSWKSEPLNIVEIYDPTADAWTIGPPLNFDRCSFGLVANGTSLWAIGDDIIHGDPKVEILESPFDQKWTIIDTFNDNLYSNKFANAFSV